MKVKEEDEAPCNEGTSSKPPHINIDKKPESNILQRKNQGQKKIKYNVTPKGNTRRINKCLYLLQERMFTEYRQDKTSHPGTLVCLTVIVSHVLTLGIWPGIANIIKTLEASLQDQSMRDRFQNDFVNRKYTSSAPPFMYHIECFKFHNYGNIAHDCRYKMKENSIIMYKNIWRRNINQEKWVK